MAAEDLDVAQLINVNAKGVKVGTYRRKDLMRFSFFAAIIEGMRDPKEEIEIEQVPPLFMKEVFEHVLNETRKDFFLERVSKMFDMNMISQWLAYMGLDYTGLDPQGETNYDENGLVGIDRIFNITIEGGREQTVIKLKDGSFVSKGEKRPYQEYSFLMTANTTTLDDESLLVVCDNHSRYYITPVPDSCAHVKRDEGMYYIPLVVIMGLDGYDSCRLKYFFE